MTNMAIFPSLKIVEGPDLYPENATVEIKAADWPYKKKFPACYKFVFRGSAATNFSKLFKKGDVVRILAIPDTYRGRVYGLRGKPIKASNGKDRWTTKNRFHILRIKAGRGAADLLEELDNRMEV